MKNGPLFFLCSVVDTQIPATGKRVQFENIYIFQIRNGKIAEYWGLFNEFSLKQQLGVIAQDDISDSD